MPVDKSGKFHMNPAHARARDRATAGSGRKVREFRGVRAANGGYIVHVEHHPKQGKKGEPMPFEPSEQHAHSNKQAALDHISALMDDMSATPEGDMGEENTEGDNDASG